MAEGLIVRRAPSRGFDFDAAAYIAAVEEADGQALEPEIRLAYNRFVLGCKDDGIWDAIKSSCIMAGARTLEGALVPLVGDAPTNFNFVTSDYSRIDGLIGDGSTKSLDTNRAENADGQDDHHAAIFCTQQPSTGNFPIYFGGSVGGNGRNGVSRQLPGKTLRPQCRTSSAPSVSFTNESGLMGYSRNDAQFYTLAAFGSFVDIFDQSQSNTSLNYVLYVSANNVGSRSNARLSFYSIGEALDLEALDNRTTALMNAIEDALT